MSTPKDGGPAFPGVPNPNAAWNICPSGMSLRDWFAGQALAGLLASITTADRAAEIGREASKFNELANKYVAGLAYKHADAMIAERGKVPDLATEGGRDE